MSSDVSPGDTILASQQTDLRDDLIDQITAADEILVGTGIDAATVRAKASQAEMEAGTETEVRAMTPEGVKQAIAALASGGAFKLIGTVAASDSATITVTGLDSIYDTYLIAGSDLVPATDGANLFLRFGDSGGIDSGASDYEYHVANSSPGSAAYGSASSSAAYSANELGTDDGNAAGEGHGFVLFLHRPGDGASRPAVSGTHTRIDSGGSLLGGPVIGSRTAVITLTQIQLLYDSGNITSGRLTVWGLGHA